MILMLKCHFATLYFKIFISRKDKIKILKS